MRIINIDTQKRVIRISNDVHFDESKVVRRPKGTSSGGEFAPKGAGGGSEQVRKSDTDSFNLGRQIDKLLRGELGRREQLQIFETVPPLYQKFGFKRRPVKMTQYVFHKATQGKHCVPINVIREMPVLMRAPDYVLRSESDLNTIVIVTDRKDIDNNPVVVIMRPDKYGEYNTIPSAYGKEHFASFLKNNKDKGNLLYKK